MYDGPDFRRAARTVLAVLGSGPECGSCFPSARRGGGWADGASDVELSVKLRPLQELGNFR
jgi:hypothetical protein